MSLPTSRISQSNPWQSQDNSERGPGDRPQGGRHRTKGNLADRRVGGDGTGGDHGAWLEQLSLTQTERTRQQRSRSLALRRMAKTLRRTKPTGRHPSSSETSHSKDGGRAVSHLYLPLDGKHPVLTKSERLGAMEAGGSTSRSRNIRKKPWISSLDIATTGISQMAISAQKTWTRRTNHTILFNKDNINSTIRDIAKHANRLGQARQSRSTPRYRRQPSQPQKLLALLQNKIRIANCRQGRRST